jgi:ribosome-binding protein aMBF1 (putative translation factor)
MMHTSKQRSVESMKKQNFGTMIATLRKEKGMTQLELAEKMGVSVAVLSFLNQIEPNSAVGMLGIGLACISVSLFQKKV